MTSRQRLLLAFFVLILAIPVLVTSCLALIVQGLAYFCAGLARGMFQPNIMLRQMVNRLQVPPDRYCITLPDGSCVSSDPRCMHNQRSSS